MSKRNDKNAIETTETETSTVDAPANVDAQTPTGVDAPVDGKKAKVPATTPAERAEKARTTATGAVTRAKATFEQAKETGDDDTIAEIGSLVTEAEAHATAAELSCGLATIGDLPHARRLAASTRAKRAAEAAEEAADTAAAVLSEGESTRIEDEIAELENCPGYSKNERWLELQDRREQLRFA